MQNKSQYQYDKLQLDIKFYLSKIKNLIKEFEVGYGSVDKIPLEDIYKVASKVFNLSATAIKGKNGGNYAVKARWFITEILVKQGWQRKDIARELGGLHVSTMVSAKKGFDNLLETKDSVYYPLWLEFLDRLNKLGY